MATLIATYTSEPGGSERLLLNVAGGMSEPPLIACGAGWLADEARERGFTVFTLPERSLHMRRSRREGFAAMARLAAHARELRQLCADVQPDLLVAWGMRSGIAAAAGLRGLRDRPPLAFQHVDFLPGPAIGRAVRGAARQADLVLCVSNATARDLDPDGRLDDKLEVIHCGVDLDRFHPDVPRGVTPRQTGDARTGEIRADALVLGAIVPWKRPDLALEAVALAAPRMPGLRLRISGRPIDAAGDELLARMRERAARPDLAGRVGFDGSLADPATALREADCLIHCSDREPFGLVIAEALASGTPVVAPNAGGPAEIVDETCGALYPPGDASAAADALVDVIGRSRELSAAARRRAEAGFALDAMQARYDELLARASRASAGSVASRASAGSADAGARSVPDAGAGVAFVAVTHNSEAELRRLVASIRRHMRGAQLVVVDNASADASAAVAREAGATVIENAENVGFGAAANAGVAAIDALVTVLVNPDVELIDASLAALAADVQPGEILAPVLLNPDGSRQDGAQPRPASLATALYALVPGPVLPGPLRRFAEPWRSRRPKRVGWATAACLVARTETLAELGPFDPAAFLYAEDLDLGLRAPTTLRPDARVVHTGAHSTSAAFGGEPFDLLAERRHQVIAERLGATRAKLDDLIQLATFADRRLLKALARRPASREAAQMRALRAARKRVP